MKFRILISAFAVFAFAGNTSGQCPAVKCQNNITVGSDPGMCSALVSYPIPSGVDTCGPPTLLTFKYTGAVQFWVVPGGVDTVTITTKGAQGATSKNPNSGNGNGGLGGTATGKLGVTSGDTLWIYVGGQGAITTQGGYSGGGFNGGGDGSGAYSSGWLGGGGGGASDVRLGGKALTNRVIVGAGGGGGGSNCGTPNGNAGGNGGGLTGVAGVSCTSAGYGNGGTQSAGGVANNYGWDCGSGRAGYDGALGVGGGADSCSSGGGGGGGYYGGAGGDFGGGGGGSSYIGGVNAGSTSTGTQTGDGLVEIAYKGSPVTVTQIAGLASGSSFPVGTTTNRFVGSNSFGSDTCSFTVTVLDSGQATVLSTFTQDTICSSAAAVNLPAGTPAGGTYTGTGVTGSTFDPSVSGVGSFWVYYTDTVGCIHSDSTMITVEICAGIQEGELAGMIQVSPNPSNGLYSVQMFRNLNFVQAEVYDAVGKQVWNTTEVSDLKQINLKSRPNGVYFLQLKFKEGMEVYRLIKQ